MARRVPKSTVDNVVYLETEGTGAALSLLDKLAYDHEPALRRFLRVRLSGHPDYEDLVQETFVRLARQDNLAAKLSRGESATRSYLFAIATNLVNDRHKSKTTRAALDKQLAEGPQADRVSASAEERASLQEDLRAVKKAIAGLSQDSRDAFILSRFEAMSYREISERMGISISMVEKHIMRAISAIKERILKSHKYAEEVRQK